MVMYTNYTGSLLIQDFLDTLYRLTEVYHLHIKYGSLQKLKYIFMHIFIFLFFFGNIRSRDMSRFFLLSSNSDLHFLEHVNKKMN